MINLFRAEVQKILGNRWIGALTVWLWPIAGMVIPIVILVIAVLSSSSAIAPGGAQPIHYQWDEIALGTWLLPTSLIGRLLMICLGAAIFAGEYSWGTWKIIVPRADRVRLVLVKYLAFTVLIILAFVAMSVLLVIGIGIVQTLRATAYGPELSAEVVQRFLGRYVILVCLTAVNVLISVGFAALAAAITRSPIGSIMGALAMLFLDTGFSVGITLIAYIFQNPSIASLARLTTGLNIPNVSSWVMSGQPTIELIQGAGSNSLAASFAVLIVWAIGLIALNLIVFQRQDLQ